MAEPKTQPEAAIPSPGIDTKVDPQKVKARTALLVKHGTDPLLAEKIAEDAEQAQIAHDKAIEHLKTTRAEDRAALQTTMRADEAAAAKKGGK